MSTRKNELRLDPMRWDDWESYGKKAFILNCMKLLKIQKMAKQDVDPIKKTQMTTLKLSKHIYKLFHHGIYGGLTPEQIEEAVFKMVLYSNELITIIMDVLNIFDSETSLQTQGETRRRMGKLCKLLEPILTKRLLQERLELDTLGEFKIVTNKSFYTKFIKIKTKLYYKQNKFNLYREESEGYAKLISELNQSLNGQILPENLLEDVKSLIGCFNLDPTRVLDVMLDSFEANLDFADFYCPLIVSFVPDRKLLCEVLGFRYSTYLKHGVNSMFFNLLTAVIIQRKILVVTDVLPWLAPGDELILKEIEYLNKVGKHPKKSTVVSVKDAEEAHACNVEQEMDTLNQKLGLCEAFLNLGDWFGFKSVMKHLPTIYVMKHMPIAVAICKMLHYIIHPLYIRTNGLGDLMPPTEPEYERTKFTPKQTTCFCGLKEVVFPILSDLGGSLHYDPRLLFKIVRICTFTVIKVKEMASSNHCYDDEFICDLWNKDLCNDIISLLDSTLLPALCYMETNCCAAEAIWNLIKLYPLQERYSMYSRWNAYILKYEPLIQKSVRLGVTIKSCMKRVSKENVKQVGRLIGKLSHYTPGPLFEYVILQIQMYDNLIAPVVDSLRYLNNLSYDVLGFSIIDSLTNINKRGKCEGNTVAQWFQSTATFCAAVFKKYNIALSGMLHYLIYQLQKHESFDLLILKELVNKMAGVEVMDDITNHQLEALAGGELLRNEAGYFVQPRNTKKSALRLKEALEGGRMIPVLAIMIAQERSYIAFHCRRHNHLKLIGKLLDECHDTLLHFGTFLAGPTMRDVHKSFPPFIDLLTKYNLGLDVTFLLIRPLIIKRTNTKLEYFKSVGKSIPEKESHALFVDILYESVMMCASHLSCLKRLNHLEDIKKEIIALFWILNLSDLYVPTEAYDTEIKKLRSQLATTSTLKEHGHKSKKEIERLNSIIDKLTEEKLKQYAHIKAIWSKLALAKSNWFISVSSRPAKNEIITFFLELCIFPRIMLSSSDALFCAQFIKTLHQLRTPNFSTLLCYDRLFCDITYTVASCTENEANRYGRFLCAVLDHVMQWHSNQELYELECANTPGFVTKFRGCNEFAEPNDNVHFENYRHVCHKWHYKLTKAFLTLLESKDYIQMRNGIIVLMRILPQFPAIARLSIYLERRIQKIKEVQRNIRPDVYALAVSYCGQLLFKVPYMMNESDFHLSYNFHHLSDETFFKNVEMDRFPDGSSFFQKLPSEPMHNTFKGLDYDYLETDERQYSLQDFLLKPNDWEHLEDMKYKVKASTSKQSKKSHYAGKSEKRKSCSMDSSPHISCDEENADISISPTWKPSSPIENIFQSSSDEMGESKLRKTIYSFEKQNALIEKERRYRDIMVYSDDDKLSDVDSWGYDSYLPLSKDENVAKPGSNSSGMSSVKKNSDESKRRKVDSPLRTGKVKSSSKQSERVFIEQLEVEEQPIKKGRSARKSHQSEDKERKERKMSKKRERQRASKSSSTQIQKGRKDSEKITAEPKPSTSQNVEADSPPDKKKQYSKEKECLPRDPRRHRDYICKGNRR